MILFINSEQLSSNVVPYKQIADLNVFEINFRNNAVLKENMLELICNFIDALSGEEERFLLIINDLDDALMNLDKVPEEMANIRRSLFRSLLETYIKIGHEIVYFTFKGDPVNPYILEYEEMDGFEIIKDEVQLYNKLVKSIQ